MTRKPPHIFTGTPELTRPRDGWLIAVALVLAAIAFAVVNSGCTNVSPVRQVTLAQDSYAATLDLLTDLRVAGKISDADAVRIEAVLIVADNAFAVARQKAVAGDKAGYRDALAVALKSLAEVDAFLREHK